MFILTHGLKWTLLQWAGNIFGVRLGGVILDDLMCELDFFVKVIYNVKMIIENKIQLPPTLSADWLTRLHLFIAIRFDVY